MLEELENSKRLFRKASLKVSLFRAVRFPKAAESHGEPVKNTHQVMQMV